ncbi:ATP-dependent RNA helicase eIF4A [Salpingoeca rosetta]|uniref:RNA helicase n=1 Tax=Salpingoeca rosetta (strain ATCC 50818 / BSB-021) TaxID=946362 RepID=F2TWU9_SALR5|nr:ATP-dependent RNA helicase eIF4A [Salpingoeca rosetta]EGD72545.1 ATP-dependent RNA helicase eIF4A [Salpingoeca rosetta]|eukprot:XP_004999114.1 ATP-dependent RNA helicase eIF4A [Salpingoeca rosetta]
MSEFEDVDVEGAKWSDAIPAPSSSSNEQQPAEQQPAEQQPAEQQPQVAAVVAVDDDEATSTNNAEASTTQASAPPTAAGTDNAEEEEALVESFKSKTELQSAFQSLTKKFVDTQANVHVQQADSTSPLYAAMEFEDVGKQPNTLPINPNVLKAARAMQYKKPSKIQSTALPLLLKNPPENLVFQSQPGTGKTAAFTMNVLTRVDPTKKFTQALYVSPTFQLCFQTSQVIEALAQYTGVEVGLLFSSRDADATQQVGNVADERGLAKQQVLCCTIKKLVSSMRTNRNVSAKNVRILVVDEADAMLESAENFKLLKTLKKMLPPNVQVIMLSATFPDHVMGIAHEVAPNANIITIPRQEVTVKDINQLYISTPSFDRKIDALLAIYESLDVKQAIVFCNTKRAVEEVTRIMREEGHRVCTISSNLTKSEQLAQLDRFLSGLDNLLVATDMLSRGIDIPQISVVINFDVPIRFGDGGGYAGPGYETYAHRIGRLGCFRGGGAAITFVQTRNEMQVLDAIREYFATDIREVQPDEADLKAQAKIGNQQEAS